VFDALIYRDHIILIEWQKHFHDRFTNIREIGE
jgi:hypothetical protein